MTYRIRTSVNHHTGRRWDYVVKTAWDRTYYSFNGPVLRWRRTKAEAREVAQAAGDFRWNDEPRMAA